MKIIRSPWRKELMELVVNAKKSIKIVSPFIKENTIIEILSKKQSQVKIELITLFKFSNFCSSQSDLSALNKINEIGGKAKIHPQLNANYYLFDDKKALILSGSVIEKGLLDNYEYGILIDDKMLISEIVADYNALIKHENTRVVKKAEIEIIEKMVAQVFKANNYKKTTFSKQEISIIRNTHDVAEVPIDSIRSVFQGWQLEVFNCINLTQHQIFTTQELNSFENHLKKLFPTQKNIPDKIKIQLEYFIELGLILPFVNGIYKKLWR